MTRLKCLLQLLETESNPHKVQRKIFFKKSCIGVSVVAQWLTNPTRNHEGAGSIPGLAQWVKDPVLL